VTEVHSVIAEVSCKVQPCLSMYVVANFCIYCHAVVSSLNNQTLKMNGEIVCLTVGSCLEVSTVLHLGFCFSKRFTLILRFGGI